jgi:hypothetical protein
MESSLFSINQQTILLESTVPTSDQTFTGTVITQGVTKLTIDYSTFFNYSIDAFKVVLRWPGQDPVSINDYYVYASKADPLSTFSPYLSGLSSTVIVPKSIAPTTMPAVFKIYFENGVIFEYNYNIISHSDNIIDLELDVLDIQNTDQSFGTVYNVQSNKGDTVFNFVDNN